MNDNNFSTGSNVVNYPDFVGVEINAGIVTSSKITDANGTRDVPDDIGKRKYWVDVIEAGGGRIGMWDGEDRREAWIVAEECRRDFGGRIRDLTGEAA